ncbi:MAG: QdtB [Candidatus Woesebacteria bacterium GW2011_GWB1_38_5b]|uniref:QdtB n=1 Tax=Candidatus Woesebacteria bacterium GW2011_GWB1_38_5b TaxID=1618569 RepID=A0A0G0K3K9_9BACT|nr:MAG: QdtB [Candidatus Woesebacteria bacterium GW2011_GWB1_38_5b]
MIPFVDLRPQNDKIRRGLEKAFRDSLDESYYILGPSVKKFENSFANYLGVKYCLGVASGTDALVLALKALNIGPGDEVIVPANTFIATALAVSFVGAKPVLVDADYDSFNIDVSIIEKAISQKTKAIIPVDLYGQPADMKFIRKIARKHKLFLVEDAAQAHGARINGRRIGNFADITTFSFYPAKNLGALGDGGAVVTNNKTLFKNLSLLRNYGQRKKYYHDLKGLNTRLDSIQASFLDIKLKELDKWNSERLRIVSYYQEGLENVREIKLPYVVRAKRRDKLQDYLTGKGIQTQIHYPIPIHLQKAYKDLNYKKGDFPVSEKLASETLSLPFYPGLQKTKVAEVVSAIKLFYNSKI